MTTVITKPTWNVDGWSGNTIDDDGVDWFVHDDKGWWSPLDVRTFDEDRPAADGTYSSPSLSASRVITLVGYAQAPDAFTADRAVNQINEVCRSGHLHVLLVEEPIEDKFAYVKRGGGNLTRTSPTNFEFQLILIAPDPRKFFAVGHSLSTSLAAAPADGVAWNGPAGTTGTEWSGPAAVTGLVYQTDSGIPGLMQLTNDGTASTPIVFTVDGPVVQPSIRNLTTGQLLTFGGTLVAGDHLVIDTGPKSVLLNGVSRKPEMTRREWFEIPGLSSILVSFESISASPTALLTAQWFDASI